MEPSAGIDDSVQRPVQRVRAAASTNTVLSHKRSNAQFSTLASTTVELAAQDSLTRLDLTPLHSIPLQCSTQDQSVRFDSICCSATAAHSLPHWHDLYSYVRDCIHYEQNILVGHSVGFSVHTIENNIE